MNVINIHDEFYTMPGIITHYKIIKDSIEYLHNKKKKNFLLRSIESLFTSPSHLKSAFFGSLGPNIFDYIPIRNHKNNFGHDISFFLHNGESDKLIQAMLRILYSYSDKNNEWSSMQRAYIYGFLSHIISDSIFHPFVFFLSGFPENFTKREIQYYREQNLLFYYTIDQYIQTQRDDSKYLHFSLEDMLPVFRKYKLMFLYKPIKSLILESFKREYPDIYRNLIFKEGKNSDSEFQYSGNFSYLDLIPYFMNITYKIKMSKNQRFREVITSIRRKKLLYSDFIVLYPFNRVIDMHVLNHYRERWQYPVGQSSIHYESVDNLLQISCEKIVEIWEKVETSLYDSSMKDYPDEIKDNAFTGENKHNYFDMKAKNPIRIRYQL